jgi:hypothetical protein
VISPGDFPPAARAFSLPGFADFGAGDRCVPVI